MIGGVALRHPPKVVISKIAYQFHKYDVDCIWNVDESGAQTGKNGGVRALASKEHIKYIDKCLMNANIFPCFLASMPMEIASQIITYSRANNVRGTTSKDVRLEHAQ